MARQAFIVTLLSAALSAAGGAACLAGDIAPDFNLNRVSIRTLPPCRPDIPPVPPPTDTGYYSRLPAASMRLESYVRVEAGKGGGRAEIRFPKVDKLHGAEGYRSELYIFLKKTGVEPELSWASVLCAGGTYFGYKGSTLRLSKVARRVAVRDDALVLGPLKGRLGDTHPWLSESGPLDRLCSGRKGYLKPFLPSSLPASYTGFSLEYSKASSSLSVTWGE